MFRINDLCKGMLSVYKLYKTAYYAKEGWFTYYSLDKDLVSYHSLV